MDCLRGANIDSLQHSRCEQSQGRPRRSPCASRRGLSRHRDQSVWPWSYLDGRKWGHLICFCAPWERDSLFLAHEEENHAGEARGSAKQSGSKRGLAAGVSLALIAERAQPNCECGILTWGPGDRRKLRVRARCRPRRRPIPSSSSTAQQRRPTPSSTAQTSRST